MSVRDDILVFLRTPREFAAGVADESVWLSALDDIALPSIARTGDRPLRPAQDAAWRGLASERAGLVLGPPGTGKTHLLSWMIAAHAPARLGASLPARTLVTAFTKNAIGNVLDAVAKRQAMHDPSAPKPIYFGSLPAAPLSEGVDLIDRGGEADLIAALETGRAAVGMTVWSLYRLLTSGQLPGGDGPTAPLFDLICVDEASQMVLGHGLMALGGLAPGGRIVVSGDDQQLPPVRALREISVSGRNMGGSLYAFLKSAEAAEFALEETFRLNGPLTDFPERKFYPGRYVSAEPETRLSLRDNWREGLDLITRSALDPNFPVVVLVHDGPSASTSNPLEASLASRIATALADTLETKEGGQAQPQHFWSEIAAIVSPHRAQNALIRQNLPEALRAGAFVETVDRIQGKERDAVILSYCVSDPEFALAEAEFIFSSERLNVASTRARSKLVMIVSRRLLDAIPPAQEVMDKAEILREFVYSCALAAETSIDGPRGRQIKLQIRARGFAGAQAELDLSDEPPPAEQLPDMSEALEGVLAAIRLVASQGTYSWATLAKVKRAMARPAEPFAEARDLHRLGWISLEQKTSQYGTYWRATPFAEARRVYAVDPETVRSRIGVVVREAKVGRHAYYERVRDRFAWMDGAGNDLFMGVLQRLEAEGVIAFAMAGESLTIVLPQVDEPQLDEALEPAPELTDQDFDLLNRLEDHEAARINFGVSESWTSIVELARRAGRSADAVTQSLSRLEQAGHVLLAEDARVRSRIGELAREVRHVKQRFRSDDADRRPYLVRSLKLELKDREKPSRDRPLSEVLAAARADASASQARAIEGLGQALGALWGESAALAAFQERAMLSLLGGWRGEGAATVAIAADTGSGKTEAACLPLIAGALADRIDGVGGTRALLAYPRIRLAANQAQRLAGYLAACAAVPGLPLVTLGIQVKDVPDRFEGMHTRYAEMWPKAGPNALRFPFFGCPACGEPLALKPGEGAEGADALVCAKGDWRFDGWIGSKEALWDNPPALFLPTTDSLHQWMHDPRASRLFGDEPGLAPPRALLADEIHLYTHIHGAQVAYALRRLAARAKFNDPLSRDMLAIGMSATIGDPARAWGRLIGRDEAAVVRPEAGESNANPRGREYFMFVQPEVESRGSDIAGASTTIQSLMCLAHGMRRRTGDEGGYRTLVFFDSIDKMRRLHGAYMDAEEKELAAYRITAFGDDAHGEAQGECCREPYGCGRFRDGECWWFAANDLRQCGAAGRRAPGTKLRVAPSPIYSGTSSNAEDLIKGSDIVFTTSSLEVGYDDPHIALVYQHYAPQNLASFVQRKGRGGRGLDDRPLTAVTLSIYSPRDSWWFRKPADMVTPKGFEAPINPGNAFVRRGQILSSLLDGLARFERAEGHCLEPDGQPSAAALASATGFVEAGFGASVWSELGFADASAFWRQVWAARKAGPAPQYLSQLRSALPWAPDLLFDTINLPALEVAGPDVFGGGREDVTLAFATVAPGNATRRYNPSVLHWRPPVDGRAPWLASDDYAGAERLPLAADEGQLLAGIPEDARPLIAGLHLDLCRPTRITLKRLGWMAGAFWNPELGYDPAAANPIAPLNDERAPVRHDSRGELRGFLLISANEACSHALQTAPIAAAIDRVDAHAGEGARQDRTGLNLARVYWGADAEVRLDVQGADPVPFTQIFTDPASGKPLLHGYRVESEGVRLTPCKASLDRFVEGVVSRLESDERERRWRYAQFTRYVVESRARAAGVNAYEARRGADLLVAAAGEPDLRAHLNHLLRFWSPEGLKSLFEDTRATLLHQHPLMTKTRVARTADALSGQEFQKLIREALDHVKEPANFAAYIRSLVLHSLAVRVRQWAANVGQADESRLLAHVALPLQFGADASDVITICEAGAHGDGTIRTLVANWDEALVHWTSGRLSDCPNATEDAILAQFWCKRDRHQAWREMDPRDPAALRAIADELLPDGCSPLPALVLKILFDMESVEAEPFTVYDIAEALQQVRAAGEERAGRELTDWEFASAAVSAAQDASSPLLRRLLDAYGLVEASAEGSLSPEARLADQAFRLATPLCLDGCRGCVQQPSDLMTDSLAAASVSRQLLQQFLASVEQC